MDEHPEVVVRSPHEIHALPEGALVLTAGGELRRVSRHHSGGPAETWLDHWAADEDAIVVNGDTVDGPRFAFGGSGESAIFPLTRVTVSPIGPGDIPLTEDERSYLAMHARYEAGRQDDVRYWDADPQKRLALKRRWTEIADWLHPQPFGDGPATLPATLVRVEDGYMTAWNAGHTERVKVVRDVPGEVPLVECPDCGTAASVDAYGHVKCLAVPGCFGGWRVTVGPVHLNSDAPTKVGGL